MIQEIDGGICSVEGVRAFGIKKGKYGLGIILADGPAAGVFTRNKVRAAPVIVTEKNLSENGGYLSGIIVNSGNANAFTGERGISDAKEMIRLLAGKKEIDEKYVAVASTGIIGKPLDIDWIRDNIDFVLESLRSDEIGNSTVMKSIMTTDTVEKECAVEVNAKVGKYRIGGICKGAGMIEPNMGTMLAFIYTDAVISSVSLDKCLKESVNESFNMVVVDGDTSTNDMCLITSTGCSKVKVDLDEEDLTVFRGALDFVLKNLAKKIARDGEGATRMIEANVSGAKTKDDAILASKAIVRSPLFKSAIFGQDPNWGRAVCAIGYSGADFDQNEISLSFSDGIDIVEIVKSGKGPEFFEKPGEHLEKLKNIMKAKTVYVHVDLAAGEEDATAWGCDLTYDYVKINADYTT